MKDQNTVFGSVKVANPSYLQRAQSERMKQLKPQMTFESADISQTQLVPQTSLESAYISQSQLNPQASLDLPLESADISHTKLVPQISLESADISNTSSQTRGRKQTKPR